MNKHDHNSKKRKVFHQAETHNTFKPSARFTPHPGGRQWTLSVAIPGSILSDCSTSDQRTTLPGRIARALAVFSVDELVIFDDSPSSTRRSAANVDPNAYTADVDPCHFLAHLFSYVESPPFMRRHLFPLHPNLRLTGLMPSLDMPHHPHPRDCVEWREGVTVNVTPGNGKGTLVDIGAKEHVEISDSIPPKTRVTLRFSDPDALTGAEPVDPSAPRAEGGYYWGYTVRRAPSLSAVFTESTFEDGYDASIGTSERGVPISKAFPRKDGTLRFQHLIVVFGGPRGLEYAAMNDDTLVEQGIEGSRTRELFDNWVNVLPGQGSRTVRTEEAVFIALTALQRLWNEES